ncbi:Mar9 Transposase [Phytophthora megakarya]|uniref:Mar9 Transposase n=1 Tax=Phytophthora megakarya TaxID=4795 RepID=A0A225V609_9STRA|nr:Mar9 Transposase [Phytophthora megakarya]
MTGLTPVLAKREHVDPSNWTVLNFWSASLLCHFVGGQLLRHSNTIHPLLTTENKRNRIRHIVKNVVHDVATSYFSPTYKVMHLEEKWFNEAKGKKVFYILPGQAVPHR